jgi:hypothetical protein
MGQSFVPFVSHEKGGRPSLTGARIAVVPDSATFDLGRLLRLQEMIRNAAGGDEVDGLAAPGEATVLAGPELVIASAAVRELTSASGESRCYRSAIGGRDLHR